MTTKELLYVEDVLGHESYFQAQCKETLSKLKDPALRRCVQTLEEKHKGLFASFYDLL